MFGSADPGIAFAAPLPNVKKEEEGEDEAGMRMMGAAASPKCFSPNTATIGRTIEENAGSHASSSSTVSDAEQITRAAMPMAMANNKLSTSQFSAAQLFGLFENNFEQQNSNNTMPIMNENDVKKSSEGNNNNITNVNFGNILPFLFGTSAGMVPIPTVSGTTLLASTATPIDQLLQISQQISSDSIAKQQKQPMNPGSAGRRNGRGNTVDNGTVGGKQTSEVGDRKRSYPYTFQYCVLCQKNVHSSKLPCHIRQCHVGKPMFQCPVCDFTSTYSKNNVKSHMVSLHGMAGDPISYMDQYAAQVEDFMKKCFPNVRGRGRPVHGPFSPNPAATMKQPNLLMSPVRTVASSGSSSNAENATSIHSSPIKTTLAPPQQQHRRHSTLGFLATNNKNNPNGGSQQRGRQRGGHQRAGMGQNNNNMTNGQHDVGERKMSIDGNIGDIIGSGDCQFLNQEQPPNDGESYAPPIPMGMFGGAGMLPKRGPNSDVMQKIGLQNVFSPVPAFNPLLYLQQLNGLFPTTFHPNGQTFEMSNVQMLESNDSRKMEEMDLSEPILPESAATTFLDECLNMSKKILREMNNKDHHQEQKDDRMRGMEEEEERKETVPMHACHSSSSSSTMAASPPAHSSALRMPLPPLFAGVINDNTDDVPAIGADFQADEPRYFPQSFHCKFLDGPGLEKTVFNTFSDSSQLIEKFDLHLFESLLEPNANTLLTPAQKEKVSQVRSNMDNLQSFEIMFALHRFDHTILKRDQLHLVQKIAPTRADIRRFALFEQQQSNPTLDKNEQFVLELSKIERLKERLAVMILMGEFDERVAKVNQQIQCLSSAAKLLSNSAQFHTLLHLLLASINFINGDFTAQLVKGFRPTRILDMCAFKFPGGETFLEILAQIVSKHFPELTGFVNQCEGVINEAAKVEFGQILAELHALERGQALVEEELQTAGGDSRNPQLGNFFARCSAEYDQLKEAVQSTKHQLLGTLEFFGETSGDEECVLPTGQQFHPERFFAVVAQFLENLQNSLRVK